MGQGKWGGGPKGVVPEESVEVPCAAVPSCLWSAVGGRGVSVNTGVRPPHIGYGTSLWLSAVSAPSSEMVRELILADSQLGESWGSCMELVRGVAGLLYGAWYMGSIGFGAVLTGMQILPALTTVSYVGLEAPFIPLNPAIIDIWDLKAVLHRSPT